MAFPTHTLSHAFIEGIHALSKTNACNYIELFTPSFSSAHDAIDSLFNPEKLRTLLSNNYADKRAILENIIAHSATDSPDFKRFNFLAQLMLDYGHPRLNPFLYEGMTADKALTGILSLLGISPPLESVHENSFKLGENVATALGSIIYENPFLQLIYYPSTLDTQAKNPVFIIPPWINKYYIFDLSPENSFIQHLTNQGIPVYCISWVNPDHTFSNQSLWHYVVTGIQRAVENAIKNENGAQLNMVGYCIGGVALALYAAWAIEKNRKTICSLTFLATPFDFEKLDNLRLFLCDQQIQYIESLIEKYGFFSGERLSQTFSLMRANDMIIQSIVDNVYLDKQSKPIDFLFWNADVTHLPGKLHLDYLHTFFFNGGFKTPVQLGDATLSLRAINLPTYIFAAEKDHIVPWQASFEGTKLIKNATFCLGGSGHVSGVINPPSKIRYGYKTAPVVDNTSSHTWYGSAVPQTGSWWQHWLAWAHPHLGGKKHARKSGTLPVIEKSPGRYAQQKAVDENPSL